MTSTEYEIKPKRDALEKVLSRLSIQTLHPKDGGATSRPEITGAEFAGMLANLPSQDKDLRNLADLLAWSYLEDGRKFEELVAHLDVWGRMRVLFRHPGITISGALHRRIVSVVVDQHIKQKYRSGREMRRAMKIGEGRWPTIRPVAADVSDRLNRADMLLHDHLLPQLAHHFGACVLRDDGQ